MSFNDRDWNRQERSPAGRFFSRIFDNVDNPLGWSIKMFTFRGITTRAHVIFIAYLLLQVIAAIDPGFYGLAWMMMAMGGLFILVTLHEFGHCFACRYAGGDAEKIVLLPWGGLALCRPPHTWRANFITTAGGPLVNVVLAPVFALALVLLGKGWAIGAQFADPFSPIAALGDDRFAGSSNAMYWFAAAVFMLHTVNLILLAFNVLLPFFPLDGGRLVHALIWRKRGWKTAMEVATLIGFAGAGVLGLVGIVWGQTMLVVIAAFGAFACYQERRNAQAMAEIAGDADPFLFRQSAEDDTGSRRAIAASKAKQKEREQRAQEEQTIDTLLSKIAEHGMHSLSRKERATLDRLSKKRRQG